jgi:transposase
MFALAALRLGRVKKRGPDFEVADHALSRSRGGWGSKLHMVTDGKGLMLAVIVTAGQTHESTELHDVMHAVRRPRHIGWPLKLAGDKGYSYDNVREFLESCGIEAVIPRKSNRPAHKGDRFDKRTYRKRSRIERAVGWLKECRRLGTRYDKLAVNFLAIIKLAIMLKYLRVLDPSDRA